MAQEDQRDLNRSERPRPVMCCAGVQVMSAAEVVVVVFEGEELEGKSTSSRFDCHQSRMWTWSGGALSEAKYSALPRGAKKCGWGTRLRRVVMVCVSRL